MAIHFTLAQFDERKKNPWGQMHQRGLDGHLMFRPESRFYHGNPVMRSNLTTNM